MTFQARVLAFSGSLRRGSFNQQLVRCAAEAAQRAGADVTVLELRELALPLYDGDDEAAHGLPDGAKRLKQLMKEHHAFLVASPEYNSSIGGPLKNAFDWASRAEPGEKAHAATTGKIGALFAASPGPFGGVRGLITVRAVLANNQMLLIPEQVTIPKANEAFGPDGQLVDEKHRASVERVVARLLDVTRGMST